MKNKVRLAVVVPLVVVALGCSGAKNKEMLAQKDARIAQLEGEVSKLRGDVAAHEQRAAKLNNELESALAEFKNKEQVWLEQKNATSVITMSDAVLFGSGGADLIEPGKAIVDRIAGVAANHPGRTILVEGHTDNVPIGETLKEKYASNWELASARACSITRYLYWKHKINPKRLSAIGYGEHRPLTGNETPQGREKNRRVVIVIGAAQ